MCAETRRWKAFFKKNIPKLTHFGEIETHFSNAMQCFIVCNLYSKTHKVTTSTQPLEANIVVVMVFGKRHPRDHRQQTTFQTQRPKRTSTIHHSIPTASTLSTAGRHFPFAGTVFLSHTMPASFMKSWSTETRYARSDISERTKAPPTSGQAVNGKNQATGLLKDEHTVVDAFSMTIRSAFEVTFFRLLSTTPGPRTNRTACGWFLLLHFW